MTTSGGNVRLHPTRHLSLRLATAVVCGLMAVGCTTSGPTTPPPVSQEVYRTELRTAGNVLKVAFDGIEAAPPLEPLGSQIDSAASVIRATTQQLAAIVPPEQYVTGQADLISALDQLASQLSGLSAQVRSRELCAAPPAMATLSTLAGTDATRRAASALGSSGVSLTTALPAPEPLSDRRGKNGTVLRAPGSGSGEFKAENGTDHDAVVTVSQGGRAVGSLYVARGETAQMVNIPDGTYDIFYTSGTDWDGGAFTRSCAFQRFDTTATFVTQKTRRGTTYKKYSATLHSVPGGNTQIVNVPPDSFPK